MNANAAQPVLSVEGLSKSFDGRPLLREIAFSLYPGESVALLGPSGSGKTTLLDCVSGIEPYDAGRARLCGQDLSTLDDEGRAAFRRRIVGAVFQFFHLLPTLTARENVELPLQLLKLPRRSRLERVDALLRRMRVDHRAGALPEAMSGGEMQRVAIARAVAHEPSLLFADEPTGNLDSATGEEVLELLNEVCRETGAALLMATHSEAAAAACHRRLHLVDGRLAEAARP